jgi:hypothetical protein
MALAAAAPRARHPVIQYQKEEHPVFFLFFYRRDKATEKIPKISLYLKLFVYLQQNI